MVCDFALWFLVLVGCLLMVLFDYLVCLICGVIVGFVCCFVCVFWMVRVLLWVLDYLGGLPFVAFCSGLLFTVCLLCW